MSAAKTRLNIVILDACRNNPFERSFRSSTRGLAQMKAPSGTFIAYATAPGSIASDGPGKNGLFTQELIKQMKVSGIEIGTMMRRVRASVQSKTKGKQTPWESSSITGEFYFKLGSSFDSRKYDPEEEAWEIVKHSNISLDIEDFINAYPSGRFTCDFSPQFTHLE